MKTGFEFEQVGKRLPYSVPEGFFEASAERALGRIADERRSRRRLRARLWTTATAAAAVVATGLFFFPQPDEPARQAYGAAIDNIIVNMSDEELYALEGDLLSDYFLTATLD